uniref:Uncharacterized protein n=1 Tax=Strigamia maritima TaxID=126957 RepID=T1J410_STRMM
MCDIGGYLSLYTGISCMTILGSIILNIQNGYQRAIFYRKNKSRFEKIVIRKTKRLWKTKTSGSNHHDEPGLKIAPTIKTFVIFCFFLCCCFFMYHRIAIYVEYPVYETIELTQDKYIQIPNVVVCSYADRINEEKEKMIKYRQLNVENIDFLDLLDFPSKYANDTFKLWQATGDMENFQSAEVIASAYLSENLALIKLRFGNMSYFDTVFGKCIKVNSDSEIIDLTSDDQNDDDNCTVVFFKTKKTEIAETFVFDIFQWTSDDDFPEAIAIVLYCPLVKLVFIFH